MTFSPYPSKRDSLLYVARHQAVTLTCDAPSKALRPGISVSRVEPSGVLFSWYCPSSSRSLGHSLLLGQRSRLNFFSHLVRSLFHQHYRGPHTQFMGHRDNGHSRGRRARAVVREAEKLGFRGLLDTGSLALPFYWNAVLTRESIIKSKRDLLAKHPAEFLLRQLEQ